MSHDKVQLSRWPITSMARWALKLQDYDFVITHRHGANHQNADCLSLLPTVVLVSPAIDALHDKLLSTLLCGGGARRNSSCSKKGCQHQSEEWNPDETSEG